MTSLAMLAAVLLDAMAGEPRRAHPLVMFGGLATRIEGRLHGDAKWRGGLAWMLAVLPPAVALPPGSRAIGAVLDRGQDEVLVAGQPASRGGGWDHFGGTART